MLVPTVIAVLAATLVATVGTWLVYRLTQGVPVGAPCETSDGVRCSLPP